MGAWIETYPLFGLTAEKLSPLVWGRGLKHLILADKALSGVSPLVWGRGLKHKGQQPTGDACQVAPRVGAWIETHQLLTLDKPTLSPLVWGRGLKQGATFYG